MVNSLGGRLRRTARQETSCSEPQSVERQHLASVARTCGVLLLFFHLGHFFGHQRGQLIGPKAGQAAAVHKEGGRLGDLQRGEVFDVLLQQGLHARFLDLLPCLSDIQTRLLSDLESGLNVGLTMVSPGGLRRQHGLRHRLVLALALGRLQQLDHQVSTRPGKL